jgi:fermentation-respiration switch protein FrsA (DUF1100 family)
VISILVWILALYFVFGVLVFIFQRNLIYHPDQSRPRPIDYGLPDVQSVQVGTEDDFKLHAWWHPPRSDTSPVIAYFPGNAGHIGHRAEKIRPFLERGFGVLLVGYRYNAQSGGAPREEGFYRDGRAVLKFLKHRDIPLDRIVLYGESLGTAVAIDLAASNKPACLLLEAPFSSMAALAQHHYWYLPAKWLLLDRFNSAIRLPSVKAPTLIIHGKQDQIVPLKFAEALAAAAPRSPEFLVVARAGHNDLYDHGVADKAIAFIERACRASP